MAERLAQTVVRLGIPVERMTVEVAETSANGNLSVVLENLARLRMRGFALSVAEGVETAAEMQLLKDAGCDCVQDYWLAAPMCRVRFDHWQDPSFFVESLTTCHASNPHPLP